MRIETNGAWRRDGWVRVRFRIEKKERYSESWREDSHQNHAGIRNGHKPSYNRVNWRGWNDIISFYFTRFPKEATVKDLWHHFKKFGDVREVFISKNRNKNGRRYGFARFKGVEDVHSLEKKLDDIVYGGLKMYVNTPKFGRNRIQQINPEMK